MPKPMSMGIEVEEIAFGRVFRLLDGMPGVVSINIVGRGPKAAKAAKAGKSTQKKGGSQSAPCLVLGALIDNGPQGRDQLGPVLVAGGKKVTTLPDTLQKLKNAKEITATGKGRDVKYKITKKGEQRYSTACVIQPRET